MAKSPWAMWAISHSKIGKFALRKERCLRYKYNPLTISSWLKWLFGPKIRVPAALKSGNSLLLKVFKILSIHQVGYTDFVVMDGYSRKKGLVQPLLVLCVQGWHLWHGLPNLSWACVGGTLEVPPFFSSVTNLFILMNVLRILCGIFISGRNFDETTSYTTCRWHVGHVCSLSWLL